MNEWLVGYLLNEGKTDMSCVKEFRPSVCSRLDRNTGGILLCAKTLQGARIMAELLRDRTLRKFYQAVVVGKMDKGGRIEGYLEKDRAANAVTFTKTGESKDRKANQRGSFTICRHGNRGD